MIKCVKNLFLVLILMVSIVVLAGCTKRDSKLIGTWEYSEGALQSIYVFNEDGTGHQFLAVGENSSNQNYTYETKDGKILITFENDTDVFEYGYRFSGDDLVLKDTSGDEFTCKKK